MYHALLTLAATAAIPLTTLASLTIYLATNPASPITTLFAPQPIALPVHNGEALDGLLDQKDPFDIHNPTVCEDGTPVEPERFWAAMWRRKLAVLVLYLLPLACNICLLAFSIVSDAHDDESRQRSIALSVLLLASQVITLLLSYWHLAQRDVASHWATTIHLAVDISTQFLVLAFLSLLPSSPLPSDPVVPTAFNALAFSITESPVGLLKTLLPILYLPSLVAILSVRRGPPLYLPLDAIYPSKIIASVPEDASALDPTQANVSPEVQANVPEWLLFGYATGVIRKGYVAESMDVWDLPILPATLRKSIPCALVQFQRMKKAYGHRKERLGRMEGFNLLLVLAKVNIGLLVAQTVLATATAFGYYLPHYLLKLFINFLENDPTRSEPAWGWLLCFGLFTSNALIFIASGVTWSICTTYLQGKIRLQLNTMLFKKTLLKKDIAGKGSNKDQVGGVADEAAKDKQRSAQGEKEDGDEDEEGVSSKTQIMSLFTIDVDRVTEFVFHLFAVIDAPLEIVVASIFVFKLLGISAMYGLLTAVLSLPLNHFASKIVVRAQENLMKNRDQRTALMNEILQGIRMLKFMAWERSFETRVQSIRTNELSWQARNYQIEVAFNCIWALTPVMVTVVSFLHYTLVRGQTLTPSVAFTSVAVFAELRYALNAIPETFIQALQGFVSCRRIEKYLSLAEVPTPQDNDGQGDIILSSATFTWPQDDFAASAEPDTPPPHSAALTPKDAFTLADLNLQFPNGKLTLICGRLGSGKTLLLSGLLGEADLVTGNMVCPRSSPDAMQDAAGWTGTDNWIVPNLVGYVPQQAWLQNQSIKENIIFSSPWDAERYQQVLEACSLTMDLEILEDGDETEIGEKGLNLSGGQKARVSLARAIYSRAGVLLLDDVLSAVDAHTAHAIMHNCLKGPIVEGRTIVVVSHHVALVSPGAAYIVALENGDVKFSGSRDEFVATGLLEELEDEDSQAKFTEAEQQERSAVEEAALKPAHKSVVSLSGTGNPSEPTSETSSLAPEDEVTLVGSAQETKSKPPRKLIEDEKRARGRIAADVWKTYFKALGGPWWWAFFLLSLAMAMVVPVCEKGWLEYWTGSDPSNGGHTSRYYVMGYSIITIVGVFAANIQYAIIYYGSLQASRKLHNSMLESVLFSTLRFHDTTSRGRLLNRFGKDIEGLDSSTADNFVRSVAYGLNVVITFISITWVGGMPFVLAGCVVLIVYYQAGSIYGQTSRDMRRLDSVTRSPLYSLFGETVSGVAVLRAFGGSTLALHNMMKLADTNLLAFAWSWTVNRWLSARFNLLSAVMVGLTAVAILIAPSVNAAMAGFALSFAGTICHDLLFVVRRFVQLEQSMVAIERLKEFTELKREAAEYVEPRPAASWPENGAIQVEDLVIRYAPDLPSVLHRISFEIAPREKVGIVGPTGCGKSTLALSFFRFVEASEGRIVIDQVDISKIGLTDLRSRLTIIPQDPTILSGTLRSTLDVFEEYDDVEIYSALRRVHLIKEEDTTGEAEVGDVDEVRNKNVFRDLNNPVSEGGDNFSSGEKQLICMARAILKRNKVILMDEATASIDYETDALISKTIREEFSDSTILTIAHRIHTIIDFDKVIVMDRGNIAEFASPAELLRDHKSKFYALCRATGRTEFKNLKALAADAERKRKVAA
ncbi:ATP-binding cassette transporter [Cryptococcus wingfieldii CBS 7118]|uniref:ATP-binding cassette transporter n=1 Tax=Cryptococcus wingfieldii CBS 7118 TaxID=1295528 RepID=A0A1E3JIY1_9TREE|nr:ATP-binding cassette transporter [Cryptococcus wingfieldii CBS 7118]ODO00841.1 ATP-binding cassette transporter [Cryptococcus wingfieldii CBS 7118]